MMWLKSLAETFKRSSNDRGTGKLVERRFWPFPDGSRNL